MRLMIAVNRGREEKRREERSAAVSYRKVGDRKAKLRPSTWTTTTAVGGGEKSPDHHQPRNPKLMRPHQPKTLPLSHTHSLICGIYSLAFLRSQLRTFHSPNHS